MTGYKPVAWALKNNQTSVPLGGWMKAARRWNSAELERCWRAGLHFPIRYFLPYSMRTLKEDECLHRYLHRKIKC